MKAIVRNMVISSALAAAALGMAAGPASAGERHGRSSHITSPRPVPQTEVCSDWTNEDGTTGTNCYDWYGNSHCDDDGCVTGGHLG